MISILPICSRLEAFIEAAEQSARAPGGPGVPPACLARAEALEQIIEVGVDDHMEPGGQERGPRSPPRQDGTGDGDSVQVRLGLPGIHRRAPPRAQHRPPTQKGRSRSRNTRTTSQNHTSSSFFRSRDSSEMTGRLRPSLPPASEPAHGPVRAAGGLRQPFQESRPARVPRAREEPSPQRRTAAHAPS